MGSYRGIERSLCADAGIPFEAIVTGKLRRYWDLKNAVDVFKLPVGIVQAFFKLIKLRPKILFSKGGYVGFPGVFAAWLLGIPVVIHESDALPGLATKLCAPFAKKIFLAHEKSKKALDHYAKKCEVIGNPVRLDLYDGEVQQAKRWTAFSGNDPFCLLWVEVLARSRSTKEFRKKRSSSRQFMM